jgi:hypothetical protein
MAHRSETSLMHRVQHTRRDRSFGANSNKNNTILIKAPCLQALAVRAPRVCPHLMQVCLIVPVALTLVIVISLRY